MGTVKECDRHHVDKRWLRFGVGEQNLRTEASCALTELTGFTQSSEPSAYAVCVLDESVKQQLSTSLVVARPGHSVCERS